MAKVNPVQLQKFLGGVAYPASKAALVDHARRRGADDNVQGILERLPDRDFEAPTDVSRAAAAID